MSIISHKYIKYNRYVRKKTGALEVALDSIGQNEDSSCHVLISCVFMCAFHLFERPP